MYQKFTSNISLTINNFQGNLEDEPCLVETKAGQGFSVSYKGKFLYSKYSPSKTAVQMVENLQILDGTVFLCHSPVLLYGIKELYEKALAAGKNFHIFLMEKDEKLNLMMEEKFSQDFGNKNFAWEKISMLKSFEIEKLPEYLWTSGAKTFSGTKIPLPGTFRRIVALNFSGGTVFNQEFYSDITSRCQNIIKTFWQNRATLIKLGRLFSKNLFKNLFLIGKENSSSRIKKIENYFGTAGKPVLVLGAGPGLYETLKCLKKSSQNKGDFFIVAVDAALPALKIFGMEPDVVVAVESQLAVEKCYVGCLPEKAVIFSDLTSRFSLNRKFLALKNTVCFFSSSYTESFFYKNLKKEGILPYEIPALGSVGLTATFLALKLRADDGVPVFVSGLDFSYGKDSTHAKGTFQDNRKYFSQNKIKNIGAGTLASVCKAGTISISEDSPNSSQQKSKAIFSEPALLSYAESFKGQFSNVSNLFNVSENGVDLGIEKKNFSAFVGKNSERTNGEINFGNNDLDNKKIDDFLDNEKRILESIKTFLVTGEKKSLPENSTLENLLQEREYLFLHFPDGHLCRPEDISFLKRVRTEIDWFLKILESGK